MKYRVIWAMDLEADTPLAAAKEAAGYIGLSPLYTVYEEEPPRRNFKVHLLENSVEEIGGIA